jgi:hypothetical protein
MAQEKLAHVAPVYPALVCKENGYGHETDFLDEAIRRLPAS